MPSRKRPHDIKLVEMTIRSINFISEAAAVVLSPMPATAMISITNPGETAPLIEGWEHVLRVRVADASYNEETIKSYGRMWHISSGGFPTKEHANAIRSFLDRLPQSVDALIIHCGAGVSRSGAVAKYAEARYRLPFPAGYNKHNEALFRLLQDPTVFDATLARYPARRPSVVKRLTTFVFGGVL